MLRRTLAAILSSVVLSLAAAAQARAQTEANAQAHATPAQTETTPARAELNEGARAYKDGRFADAEQHFRRALELDPTQKNAQLFIARAVQQQYRPGDASAENVAAGERAVAAYQDVLNADPRNDDAFNQIVSLYGQMKRDDRVLEVLNERAEDPSVPDEKRARVLVVLAGMQLKCSYDITESRENRKRDTKSGRISYHMPADAAAFGKARRCADEGLRLVEQAVSLDPNSPSAWSYKANLLREASKLAEMEGDAEHKADFEKQYEEAFDAQKRAIGEAQRREREAQKAPAPDAKPEPDSTPEPKPTPAPDTPPERKLKMTAGSFGVFNDKALSKSDPEYPAAAKAAHAEGWVAVFVELDESGNVAEAEAVSGHPLLRDSAVAAARRAKFCPTFLSGTPVRNRGVVTYNFALR